MSDKQIFLSIEILNTEYKKFWIVIPEKLLKKLGWKVGQELKGEAKSDKLIVEKD